VKEEDDNLDADMREEVKNPQSEGNVEDNSSSSSLENEKILKFLQKGANP
jgi:hypothetical protein